MNDERVTFRASRRARGLGLAASRPPPVGRNRGAAAGGPVLRGQDALPAGADRLVAEAPKNVGSPPSAVAKLSWSPYDNDAPERVRSQQRGSALRGSCTDCGLAHRDRFGIDLAGLLRAGGSTAIVMRVKVLKGPIFHLAKSHTKGDVIDVDPERALTLVSRLVAEFEDSTLNRAYQALIARGGLTTRELAQALVSRLQVEALATGQSQR